MRWYTAESRRTYVDTSAFIALADDSDSYHRKYLALFSDPPALFTTTGVIMEGYAWFMRRYDGHLALRFLSMIEALGKKITVLPVRSLELHAAERHLRKFHDQALTLVDAVGLAVMDDLNIRACWSTDRHLALTGRKLPII